MSAGGAASGVTVMRIMIRQGVSRDMAALLVDDIKRAVKHFAEHPIIVPIKEHELRVHTHN